MKKRGKFQPIPYQELPQSIRKCIGITPQPQSAEGIVLVILGISCYQFRVVKDVADYFNIIRVVVFLPFYT